MNSKVVYFVASRKVEVRSEELPPPVAGEVLVRSICSAISPGTEMLFYRGNFVPELALDSVIKEMANPTEYPIKYGYSLVGEVIDAGPEVSRDWIGRRVFAFHPHEDLFCTAVDSLMPVPESISNEDAVFLPNMETAVNFVMDGAPMIGEQVVVFGQGIVGLLTTALLALFPLGDLVTLDPLPNRRKVSLEIGVHASLDPATPGVLELLKSRFENGADLVFEISGSPEALNQALAVAGFAGRVVVGSWYGSKPVSLDLGGDFHRSRIRLLSSQVSTVDPHLSARWNKNRRYELAWQMVEKVQPSRWITQRYPLEHAEQAYQLIDKHPEESIQVLIKYE